MTKAETIRELVAAGKAMLEQDRISRSAKEIGGPGFVKEGEASKAMQVAIKRAEK